MNEKELFEIKTDKPDADIYAGAKKRFDDLAKPIDGFGCFEEMICKIASVQKRLIPDISKRVLIVMCADNGVVSEGVSQTDSSVTSKVAHLLGEKRSTVCVMARDCHVKVVPVDIGINTHEKFADVLDKKIAPGSGNIARGDAMTKEQCLAAIKTGIDIVRQCADEGFGIIATGEMGIGNTTSSAALLCALSGDDAADVAGRGAGLSDEGLNRKIKAIKKALNIHGYEGKAPGRITPDDAFSALCAVGGLDIAGLCGVYIGGAMYHIPVVIDGVISATSALAASYMVPGCKDVMIASHKGKEGGTNRALSLLGLRAVIDADMALGEGTGAVMLFPIIDMVMSVYTKGTGFDTAGIEKYERFVV